LPESTRLSHQKLYSFQQLSNLVCSHFSGLLLFSAAQYTSRPKHQTPILPLKSPQRRRSYRRSRFSEYFRNACLHEIKLSKVAVQGGRGSRVGRLVALRDAKGRDMAVGLIEKWEQTSRKVESMEIRHIIIRTGVVLGADEGFLSRILLPFHLFVGGHLGSGRQWISWIHIDDEIKAICLLMENRDLRGVFNLSAPNPLTSRDFFSTLGQVMRRPAWLPVPGLVLRLFLGEMADELILSGQRAVPKKLIEAGYEFAYAEAGSALNQILNPIENEK